MSTLRKIETEKIDEKRINLILKKMETYAGLTEEEMKIAADAGLIDYEQRYFWTPEWQKKEKEADEDIKKGRLGKPISNVEELQQYLDSLKRSEASILTKKF